MSGIIVSIGESISEKHEELHQTFSTIKETVFCSHNLARDKCSISKFCRLNEAEDNVFIEKDIQVFCVGTIYFKKLVGSFALKEIVKHIRVKNKTISELVNNFDGHFLLVVNDLKKTTIDVVTDHAGMMHCYIYRCEKQVYLSTSSYVLSKKLKVSYDESSIVQFLRCDSICDCDTFYNEIKLLDPGTIYSFSIHQTKNEKKKVFWRSPICVDEKMKINDAVEIWTETLLEVAKLIAQPRILCDLTGGFDSRSILAALLNSFDYRNFDFSTFVFGPENSKDVRIAQEICKKLKIDIMHLSLPASWPEMYYKHMIDAYKITDGEENICNYAPILHANTNKCLNFKVSINGMSGGCVRDFFWKQEIFIRKKIANFDRFIKMRVLQHDFNDTIFSDKWRGMIIDMPKLLKHKYQNSIRDMDFNNSFNTLQLDNIDLRQRERRWGGRTISSSNQVIRILSPLYFRKCIDIGFTIPPQYKKMDLLNRKVISRLNSVLGEQVMINGLPCQELKINNFYKFYPILSDMARKASKVFSRQVLKKTIFMDKTSLYPKYQWYRKILNSKDKNALGKPENWISNKFYRNEILDSFFNDAKKPDFRFYGQLDKMITLEMRFRDNLNP